MERATDLDMKPEPIECKVDYREPTYVERSYAGNNQILESRIDFHFWDGSKWIQHGCGETRVITPDIFENIEHYKKMMEHHCWRWFADMMKLGEIKHGDPGKEVTSKVLAVARHPIYFEME